MDIIVFLVLLALGYGFGHWSEQRHYRSIIRREEETRSLLVIPTKWIPQPQQVADSHLVAGSVVISVDYFKRFMSALRNLVGGRVRAYETLVDRARREAILRMKQEAEERGANAVFNVKIETSSIYKGRRNAIGSVEVLAYGTAIHLPAQGADTEL